MGRPKGIIRKLTKEEMEKLPGLAGIGCNLDQIAHIFNMSPTTLDRIMARDPKVKEAIEKGRAEAGAKVKATAFQQAVTGKNPAMTMFWLKCREKWKENHSEISDDETNNEFSLNYKK